MFKMAIVGVALLVAVLAVVLPHEKLIYLGYVSRFFEIMLPFLAVGALIKYLFNCD
jgi:hypothetical protein